MGEYLEKRTSAMIVDSLDAMSKTIIEKQDRIESLERQLGERDEMISLMNNAFMAAQQTISVLHEFEASMLNTCESQLGIIVALNEKNVELQSAVDQLEPTIKTQHGLYDHETIGTWHP